MSCPTLSHSGAAGDCTRQSRVQDTLWGVGATKTSGALTGMDVVAQLLWSVVQWPFTGHASV